MGFLKNFLNQTRKPEGFLGKIMLATMNPGHAELADWGLSWLPSLKPARLAELGCGGGRNIQTLLQKYPGSRADGIDYSTLSVEKARKTNAAAIAAGRCTVEVGDVSALPLSSESYDLATAFETVYFWPGLEKCFREVYRILKPGGHFLMVNESDGTDAAGDKFTGIIEGMRVYRAEELKAALEAAGFSRVEIWHHNKKPWLAVMGVK